MPSDEFELSHFFAWARARAYAEFEKRIEVDPKLDPNWLFSDIMQELLEQYKQMSPEARSAEGLSYDQNHQGEQDSCER